MASAHDPIIRKHSEATRTRIIEITVGVTDFFVYSEREGVSKIAMIKLRNIPAVLRRPQLIDSVTPESAVCSTASSYATNSVGSIVKPITEPATRTRVLLS